MRAVHVVGGGPAGVMAAFAAMRGGVSVQIFDSNTPQVQARKWFASTGPPPPRESR